MYFPRPCIIPLCISPQQMFPFLKQYLPVPCFLPLHVSPSYIPSSSYMDSLRYSNVLVTFFYPKIYLGRFVSCQSMTLQALSATFSVGISGNLPLTSSISNYLMASVRSSPFLNSFMASIPWYTFFFQVRISCTIFCTISTLYDWKQSSLRGSISYSLFSMSSLYRDLALALSQSMALLTFYLRSLLTLSMSSSSSMRSSYFLSLSLSAKCSGLVGQLSIFHRSFFSSYLTVMRLYLHFSWVNSVRQIEQRRGHYSQVGLRQTILIYSFLCLLFQQISLDFRFSFGVVIQIIIVNECFGFDLINQKIL